MRDRTSRPGPTRASPAPCACGAAKASAGEACAACGRAQDTTEAPRDRATSKTDLTLAAPFARGFGDIAVDDRAVLRGRARAIRNLDVDEPSESPLPLDEGKGPPAPKPEAGKKEEGEAKDTAPKAIASTCGEALDWQPNSPIPMDVKGDSLADFAKNVTTALSGTPHMAAEASWDSETDGKVVTKVNLTLKTTIIRPRYSMGRASDQEKQKIREVVDFIKAHEERHRDASRSVWQKAVCEAKGKSVAAATKILERTRCTDEPAAQAAIDAKEGQIQWKSDATGNTSDFEAVGIKQDYTPSDCAKKP